MTATRRDRLRYARIYLIATPPPDARAPGSPSGADWLGRVADIAHNGVGLVQLRLKEGDTGSRRSWLRSLRDTLPSGTLIIVNDDLEAYLDPEGLPLADGVHVGRDDARELGHGDLVRGLLLARERLGADALLGSSTRTRAEVRAAVQGGVDHVGFGAMADSPTKSGTTRADPAELLLCAEAFPQLPIFPIGGLHAANLQLLSDLPVRRAALGSSLLQADDPAAATRAVIQWARGD